MRGNETVLVVEDDRGVRDLARRSQRAVHLSFSGEETELDKTVIEQLSDPLVHLIRNAIDHGIEDAEDRKKAGKPVVGCFMAPEEVHEETVRRINELKPGGGFVIASVHNMQAQVPVENILAFWAAVEEAGTYD